MAYRNITFQHCFGFGWQGGPEFKTRIVELINGRERRNAEWSQPRHRYSAPFNNLPKELYADIKAMHLNVRGRNDSFLFVDELDYEAEDELFDVGDGVKTVFQLGKYSIVDNVPYKRNIYAIDDGAEVMIDGVPATVSIDQLRGLVTFSSAPGSGAALTWTGTFKVWVRFDNDYLPFSISSPGAVNGQVDLIEVPPPPAT